MLGKHHTDVTKEKLRIKATGRKHTEETIEKLRKVSFGKKQSPETIAKRVEKLKGQKRSSDVCEAIGIIHRKKWLVTLPDGEEIIVNDLKKFCLENGLSYKGMTTVSTGRTKQHKKYKCNMYKGV